MTRSPERGISEDPTVFDPRTAQGRGGRGPYWGVKVVTAWMGRGDGGELDAEPVEYRAAGLACAALVSPLCCFPMRALAQLLAETPSMQQRRRRHQSAEVLLALYTS
jgi:hypothetical protein